MSQGNGVIYIVGPRRLQNEMMASCLERETGAKCHVREDIFHVRFRDDVKRNGQRNVVLWDYQGKDPKNLLVRLTSNGIQKSSRDYLVLFNVSNGLDIVEKCVWEGVHGVFYEHDSLPHFLKGVRAILNGQLWLSRDIMTRCILKKKAQHNPSKTDSSILTSREGEILAQIVVGATNEQIADKLSISPHTVRTHLYNIYKKINVSNRLEAALWTAKNF